MKKQMLVSTDPDVRMQHCAVRSNVGWYDFTHHLLEMKGPDSLSFLDHMYAGAISKLAVGRAKYTTMLDEEGFITDDVIIFRLAEDHFWISTLYIRDMIRTFDEYKEGYQVEYRKITDEITMYSIQGPNSTKLVDLIAETSVDGMKFFSIADNRLKNGMEVRIARSGYTGEKFGYELYVPSGQAAEAEAILTEKGAELNATHVTEIDVMCMTLAAEAGYVLMMDIYKTTPYEVDMYKSIDWDSDFIGKAALEKIKDQPPKRKLVGFTCDDDNALIYGGPVGNPLMKNGKIIGKATKYTHGFTCNRNIGYALIDTDKAAIGDTVTINGYPVVLTEKYFL